MSVYQPKTARDLLTDLGVGRFNATMMIESMFMAPATTEVASPQIMLLVGQLQKMINTMGAKPRLTITGTIDPSTAYYLAQIAGPNFLHVSWYEVVQAVVAAWKAGRKVSNGTGVVITQKPQGIAGLDLPDVPGGMFTYAAGGLFLLHLWNQKRKSKRS